MGSRRRVLGLGLLLACGQSLAAEIFYETLAGASGQAQGWDGQALKVDAGTLALERLDRLALQADAPEYREAWGACNLGLRLRDGSWLPAQAIAPGPRPEVLTVSSPLGGFTVPLAQVAAWGARSAALRLQAEAEFDRVLLPDGQEWSVTVLAAETEGLRLRTSLDPEPLVLPWERVQAVALHGAALPAPSLRLVLLSDPALPPVYCAPGDPLTVQVLGQPLAPVEALPWLRVEGPGRRWLSALEPTSVEESGAFGVVWPWQRDRLLDGEPLVLGERRYDRGITVHSAARLVWAVPQGAESFRAIAGIADALGLEGDCPVRLDVDGKTQWQGRLRGGETPQHIQISVSGAQNLTLVIELGERFDIGDHVVLADAAFVMGL